MRCVGVGKCRRHDSDGSMMCPSYHGHPRGAALHPRPRPAAVRDAHGEPSTAAGAARRSRTRSTLPRLQGLQERLPGQRRHGDLQGRVPRPLLRGPAAPARSLRRWGSSTIGRGWRSVAPGLANLCTQTPVPRDVAKGSAASRRSATMPAFAAETFTHGSGAADASMRPGRRVMLWPDTFNNYFRPETAIAATRVLEAAGCGVAIPPRPLCCGRPLYDWGMLDSAKRYWSADPRRSAADIERRHPRRSDSSRPASAAFRDELVNLFPRRPRHDASPADAYCSAEFLDRSADDFELRRLAGKALVQIHCHHHAVIKTDASAQCSIALGLDYEVLTSGCCGMAGSFGFEADKYEVSQSQRGERVLLPRVRAGRRRHADPRRRLQLPRADRARNGTPDPPLGRGHCRCSSD